jgi:hypothetical protein
MKKTIAISCLMIFVSFSQTQAQQDYRRISKAQLIDKIKGAWAGQMIGVAYGAPVEFRSNGKIIKDNLRGYENWTPDRLDNALSQDDVYVDVTFASVLDSLGLDATIAQFGEAFKKSRYALFHANAQARQNLNAGIPAGLSGSPKYNIHANDIDFQIESDFIGSMAPGLPQATNRFCNTVGRIMNYGDGLYGGMFIAGMYAAAFFENDPAEVVRKGLACIPAESKYAAVIRDVLQGAAHNPEDWTKTWQIIEDKWDRTDVCPGGVLKPFNIDASINGAYVAMGLLYGNKDLEKTMQIAVRCGQDADCNGSSAAGILGTILGIEHIPQKYKSHLPAIADKKFNNTNYSYNDIVSSTVKRACQVIQAAGGHVSEDYILVPFQKPKAPELEQWTMGKPNKIIPAKASAWHWTGLWNDKKDVVEWSNWYEGKTAQTPHDQEAQLTFTGTAVLLMGINSPSGGRADVYIDRKKVGMIDAWVPEDTHNDALWHIYGLENTSHTLTIKVRKDADNRSKGHEIEILAAATYQ